jgi:hypothetical protein
MSSSKTSEQDDDLQQDESHSRWEQDPSNPVNSGVADLGGDNSPAKEHDLDEAGCDPEKQTEDVESKAAELQSPLAKENYSVFTTGQIKGIVVAGSFIGWFSPVSSPLSWLAKCDIHADCSQMSGSIYFPALNSIAADLNTSISKVNITVTTYLVNSPLSPPERASLTNCSDPARSGADDDRRFLRHRRPSTSILHMLHRLHDRQPCSSFAEQLRCSPDPANASSCR